MLSSIAAGVLIFAIVVIIFMIAVYPKPALVEPVITRREPTPLPKPKKLSWPAEQIVNSYERLPDENKAMGDIRMIVEALDVKHGHPSVVNRHFVSSEFEKKRATHVGIRAEHYQSWSHGCKDCWMPEYDEILSAITLIHNELSRQKKLLARRAKEEARALELAGIEPAIKDIPALMASLREEAKTIKSITEDIV